MPLSAGWSPARDSRKVRLAHMHFGAMVSCIVQVPSHCMMRVYENTKIESKGSKPNEIDLNLHIVSRKVNSTTASVRITYDE
jgi:hypothetical protein